MGIIARRDLIGQGGRKYKAGEPCPEALNWKYPALRACLNNGILEDTDGTVDRHFSPKRAEMLASRAATAKNVVKTETPVKQTQSPVTVDSATADKIVSEQLVCTSCDRTFPTAHGLKIHAAMAHRE